MTNVRSMASFFGLSTDYLMRQIMTNPEFAYVERRTVLEDVERGLKRRARPQVGSCGASLAAHSQKLTEARVARAEALAVERRRVFQIGGEG